MKLSLIVYAIAATTSSIASAQDGATDVNMAKKDNGTIEQRPACDYKLGSSGGWTNLSRFYKEVAREDSLGKPLIPGSMLIYIQLREIEIAATASEQIENRDRSPLNPNWKWPEGKTLKIWSTVTFDKGENWYRLIGHTNDSIKTSYWTIKNDGYMCSNLLSYDKKAQDFVTSYGMSRIYQKESLKFSDIEKPEGATISISIAAKEVVGAIANLQTNVAINGKSIFSKIDSVDTFAGRFEAAKVQFTTKRTEGQNVIESIQIPSDFSRWLHSDLKISQKY